MKKFKSSRKNSVATGIASKVCVWILSIMLVVTGMAPSFAANAKAGNGSAIKTAKARSEIYRYRASPATRCPADACPLA